jgi:uncharacterized protein
MTPMLLDAWFLLLLVPALAALAARYRLQATFSRYREVPTAIGLTGAEAAARLLDLHGLDGVRLERTTGVLSDHFDSDATTLRLSGEVADGRSVAALAVAAHEVAHAHQDAHGQRAYRLRLRLGRPVMQLSQWSGLILIGGFWFGIPPLTAAAAVLLVGLAAFALVTLPVELTASRRALQWLGAAGLAGRDELPAARRVLRAAAATYLAGLAHRVGLVVLLLAAVGLLR